MKRLSITLLGLALLTMGVMGAFKMSTTQAAAETDEPEMVNMPAPTVTKQDKPATAGKKAPKGRAGGKSVSGKVAPEPLTTDSTYPGVNFYYGVGSQATVADGATANFVISRPYLAPADFHSLEEMAVQSADGQQVIEVGWNVDRLVNGDSDPHLFIYHWVNKTESCYNACGFVLSDTAPVRPGDTLPTNTSKQFIIQYATGNWWIGYDGQWIGYFPESLWTSNGVASFSKSGLIQVFGEVAASSATAPCTQMGNGIFGTVANGNAARAGSFTLINSTDAPSLYVRNIPDTSTNLFKAEALSERTFRFGGPGGC